MIMPNLQTILSTPHGDLGKLLQVVNKIQSLNELVKKDLPANLRKHVRVLNLSQGKLVLEVENSSWATKLRFALPELLSSLRKVPELAGLRTIEHQIATKQHKSPASKKPEPSNFQLSEQAIESLKSCIEASSDDTLKKALKKFMAHYS
ncbi:MAG: hypothetical protein K0R66_733 [Gammaproteobacteria bacterium]|jgi:hypothetical protein|nr:hypothetical protein [Gammaproteobacteria bacterium]